MQLYFGYISCLFIYSSVFIWFYLFVTSVSFSCLPVCLPVCLSICLSVYLSVCLSICLSVCSLPLYKFYLLYFSLYFILFELTVLFLFYFPPLSTTSSSSFFNTIYSFLFLFYSPPLPLPFFIMLFFFIWTYLWSNRRHWCILRSWIDVLKPSCPRPPPLQAPYGSWTQAPPPLQTPAWQPEGGKNKGGKNWNVTWKKMEKL